jgi:hypothetical protein
MQWRGCCHGAFLDIKITTWNAADSASGRRRKAVATGAVKRLAINKKYL